MRQIRWVGVMLVVMVLLALAVPALVAAAADPIVDLAEAVAYWQDQAITAAIERERLTDELARVMAERDELRTDVAALESIMIRLRSERNDALENAKAEAALRRQAERDLEYALITIESLNTALSKLSGPRFGAIIGATYDIRARDPGVIAALQLQWR